MSPIRHLRAALSWALLAALASQFPALARDEAVETTSVPEPAPGQQDPPEALPGLASVLAAAQTTAREHPVGAEDLLEVSVFEIPELNRTVRVSEKGTISLPLLGEMDVKGLTAMDLEVRLREALSRKYLQNPQVSVFVRDFGSKKVSVIGAVGKPGVYAMLGPRTLLQILSEAGGLVKEAGSHLYVIRTLPSGTTEALPVRVDDLLVSRDPAMNLPVQAGDVISVPMDRLIYVYMDGAVKTPGRLDELASRPITLLQAIAKAGGTSERANLKNIQVLRRGENGTQIDMRVNLKRIRQRKDPDPVLVDGDVVVVSETFF